MLWRGAGITIHDHSAGAVLAHFESLPRGLSFTSAMVSESISIVTGLLSGWQFTLAFQQDNLARLRADQMAAALADRTSTETP